MLHRSLQTSPVVFLMVLSLSPPSMAGRYDNPILPPTLLAAIGNLPDGDIKVYPKDGGIIGIDTSFPQIVSSARIPRMFAGADSLAIPSVSDLQQEPRVPDAVVAAPKDNPEVDSSARQAEAEPQAPGQKTPSDQAGEITAAPEKVLDNSLGAVESRAQNSLLRRLNFIWTPGFAERADLVQVDAMVSMLDIDDMALLSQLGLQSRDGDVGANIGAVWLVGVGQELLVGINMFYDYLAQPKVDRWSIGGEVKGRWLAGSANWYQGLKDQRAGDLIDYSPDGWDVELSGTMPWLPWLEYAGRYYHWAGDGAADDLDGVDLKLELRPLPLVALSLRYDNPESAQDDFSLELEMNYRVGIAWQQQLQAGNSTITTAAWQRRFERVAREYEQRVQRRDVAIMAAASLATTASPL